MKMKKYFENQDPKKTYFFRNLKIKIFLRFTFSKLNIFDNYALKVAHDGVSSDYPIKFDGNGRVAEKSAKL